MATDPIPGLLASLDADRLRRDLFYLAKDPLPFRKLNYTRPGQTQNTLYEADDYLAAQLQASGYEVEREGAQVQAFRCDTSKPKKSQFSRPEESDPWYTAYNVFGTKAGRERPDEIIVVVAHKDSQSWVDSPGAYDNAVGTVGTLEMARVLADYPARRTIRFLYCNEEHTPWTSVTAAENAKARGDNIIPVFNIDSLGGKSQEDLDAGRKTNVSLYTEPEGQRLAELMCRVIEEYRIPLVQSIAQRQAPGDDDGSFVKAGYPAAIMNLGSFPYADPNYHAETDVPEAVDLENLYLGVQASLAGIVTVDREE